MSWVAELGQGVGLMNRVGELVDVLGCGAGLVNWVGELG